MSRSKLARDLRELRGQSAEALRLARAVFHGHATADDRHKTLQYLSKLSTYIEADAKQRLAEARAAASN